MSLAPVLLALAAVSAEDLPVAGEFDTRRVVLELVLRGQVWEEPVLLAVRGSSAASWESRVRKVHRGLALRIVEIPDGGDLDVEMALAMGRLDVDCALSLEPVRGDLWRVGSWGSCSPQPRVLMATDVGSGTAQQVARSFEGDPRPPADLVADLSLAVEDHDGAPDSGESWSLVDGTRYELSTLRFALQVGDRDMVRRLERERSRVPFTSAMLGLAGGGLSMVGSIAMLAGFSEADSAKTYPHEVQGQQLGWSGVVILGAGQLVLSAIPFQRRGIWQRRQLPDRVYQRKAAETLIDTYNRGLAGELGVGEETQGSEDEAER